MWTYQGKEYKEVHDSSLQGFIYKITYTDPKTKEEFQYIGKKQFFAKRTVKKGKKALAAMTDKRGSKKVTTVKESDWKTYQSSNQFLKKIDPKFLKKEIISFCQDAMQCTYLEVKYQMTHEVLESSKWLNGNILGKLFNQYK
jgi:hypothetical protein